MRLLVLDNYDSFTYNLVHIIEKVSNISFDVIANDKITLPQIAAYDKILLSPGPGLPSQAGIMPQLLETYRSKVSILGVCLGLQAIGEAFGCSLKNLDSVFHGMAAPIHIIKEDPLFLNCPKHFNAGRYHSWVVNKTNLSADVEVIAEDDAGLVMALRHKSLNIRGVQFHPESILSEYGETILHNWLSIPIN
ncbi:MAG: aminodeoxychorismate/anthranilate synthase component II [bacterium]|nr:aminodeoxychorismate/anthranilate synthase component II [bacterium]